jgi:hypothetical protein
MIDSEFLSSNELAEISGCKLPSGQRDWLDRNGWKYVLNAANRPIVGRYFARLHLAGVSVAKMAPQEAWRPDFSMLKEGK